MHFKTHHDDFTSDFEMSQTYEKYEHLSRSGNIHIEMYSLFVLF